MSAPGGVELDEGYSLRFEDLSSEIFGTAEGNDTAASVVIVVESEG